MIFVQFTMNYFVRWNAYRNKENDPAFVYIVKTLTKAYCKSGTIVIADSAFESDQIMEWGTDKDVMIAFAMTSSGSPICHPEYFRGKNSAFWKHFKHKEKRGELFTTYSDNCTYTFYRDSSVLKLVDNDLPSDIDNITPRVIRRFYKDKAKGSEDRWKGLCQVYTSHSNHPNESMILEVWAPPVVHFFKSYYGRVDAANGLLSRYGFDTKTLRQTMRVIQLCSKYVYLSMG